MDDRIDAQVWRDLAQPGAYPSDPTADRGVESIETHISHVFLTSDRVYKFRKPVDLGFVRFATREERNADCRRELELNRRLAPDVYLGIAPLLSDGNQHRVGPVAEQSTPSAQDHEHCVVMRRLPDGRDARSLLERGELTPAQVDRLADTVAHFHASHGLGVAPFTAHEWRKRIIDPVEDTLVRLAAMWGGHPLSKSIEQTLQAILEFPERHGNLLDRRRFAGYVVDGHGDLHLDHIWFEQDDSQPLIIDCLEFDCALRMIDAASEVAFPAMDLMYRGRRDLAARFLSRYARETDDYDLYSVVDFFISYRAAVRAKIASIVAKDSATGVSQRTRAEGSATRHVELAAEAASSRDAGALVLVSGLVGSGKSSVAAALADQVDGAVISSDRIRKRICGLLSDQHVAVGTDEGIYAPVVSERVYSGMLDRARPIVESGRVAILDATFGLRRHRAAAVDLAHSLGAAVYLLEARCAAEIALDRLARRQAIGSDPSDAGPDFYETSVARFEPARGEMHLDVVRTDRDGWQESLGVIAAAVRNRS
jgi:aminoglycoside phosphotransferase family enzyme/predicted kinase